MANSKIGWLVVGVVFGSVLMAILFSIRGSDDDDAKERERGRIINEQRQQQQREQLQQFADQRPAQQQPAATVIVHAPVQTVFVPIPAGNNNNDNAVAIATNAPPCLKYSTEMHYSAAQPEHDRHLVDMAAIHEATSKDKVEPLKIPKVIHQISVKDQVPRGMRDAMHSIMSANTEFEHVYYSDERGQEFFDQKYSDGKYRSAYQKLLPTKMRAEFATAGFLWDFAGVHLHQGFTAGAVPLIKALKHDDELVMAVYPDGRISTEFIAAKKNHPVIGKWLEKIVGNIHGDQYGSGPEAISGSVALRDAFMEVVKEEPKPGYAKDGIRLLKYERDPECLIGQIIDPNNNNAVLFNTRYPMYGRETRWYRIWQDDAEAMWQKRHAYGAHDCYMGLTLGQENDGANEAPDRHQILVDMAPYHPAREVVGQKQKIPRIIMQTNSRDQVPKDLRKVMQGLIDINPEYEHYYFSDRRIRDFIKKHFDEKTLKAFDAVVPGAYKADLFR